MPITGYTKTQSDTLLAAKAPSSALTAKADLVGGLVPTSQIPALALNTSVTVASQTAMLALTTTQVQPGDLAIRTDGAGTFILTATDPTQLANWSRLNAPTDAVTSVNSQSGTVVLAKADVGLGNVDNTSDANKPVSTAAQTVLNSKASVETVAMPARGGNASPGTATTASAADHIHPRTVWDAADQGFTTWSFDPILLNGSSSPAVGLLYVSRVHVPVTTTITNLWLAINTVGTSLTAGQCFAGLYDASGNLVAATGDQSTNWASVGMKTMPLVNGSGVATPVQVPAGDYFVGFYANGTATPAFFRGTNTVMANANVAGATARFANANTGLTTTVPPTLNARTTSNIAWWVAAS